MKRRDFLKNMPLAVVPLLSNKLFANVMPISEVEQAAMLNAIGEDKILVIIQLEGGNDGLNMVLPLDQYTNLAAARSNILIPSSSALQLGNYQTGLHPAMTGLKTLYDANRLCVVQGVSYANPNLSHFRSTDVMLSGSDSSQILDSGWAGRFLEYNYPGFPTGYPNTSMPDPLAIQISQTLSRGLFGASVSTGQTVPWWFNGNVTQLPNFTNSVTPTGHAGNEAAFLRNQQASANLYASSIVNAWAAGTNTVAYPPNPSGMWSYLGEQLKVVARLIKGGLKTRIYWVEQYGYDTHSDQVNSSNHSTGYHATLLKDLSDSILAFQTDLNNMNMDDKVMGMTFSEFGRRVKSNGSTGTDHGTAAPMLLFGKYVNPAVVGTNAVIPSNALWDTNVPTQFDYRQVYQAILQGWFCTPPADIAGIIGTWTPAAATNTVCLSVLPIEMMRFLAEKANQQDVHVEWITASEQNVRHFEVQRSTDGVRFTKVDIVKAKGHAHEPTRYDILDKNAASAKKTILYYRLKIVDNDDSEYLSEIKSVRFEATEGLQAEVFPNPTTGLIHIDLKGDAQRLTDVTIRITDSIGRRVFEQQYPFLETANRLDIDLKSFSADGIYFISLDNAKYSFTKRIVVSN
jgi:uncharacterized protein (DUF1501 family)